MSFNFYLRHLVMLHKLPISLFVPSTQQIVLRYSTQLPMSVAARSRAWVCCSLLAEIVGSNPDCGMEVCLLRVLCVVRQSSQRRADHSSRGILPSVAFLSVIVKRR